ncbi:MAG: Mrp/NBP35 family ATP-binding protein [Lentisphaeria bacterium]|nr:Mrp/NBP35 family ATP-binding protein [Lentisphaeria bacterium]
MSGCSSSGSCSGNCSSCGQSQEAIKLAESLGKIKRKIVVMSGKGGVGKSTVAANLAYTLARSGRKVGLLDVDVHGPSIPKMLGVEDARPEVDENEKIVPADAEGVKVISMGFMLDSDDAPIVWRGPVKIGVIKQLLGDVAWGELDALVIDCPPGTGDEPLTVCQTVAGEGAAAVIVTTPQKVSAADVSRSINFCKQLEFPIAGLLENMSGFVCPHCNEITQIFASGAGEMLAEKYEIPFLGKLPIDPAICAGGDAGTPFSATSGPAADAFRAAAAAILEEMDKKA